ncbi:MAG: flagellar assembly protein FliH [Sulfurimonas sp.]|nr:flagellar assembly protein FliH [Sulfurimonas sp.]MBU3939727.1 flagellar assembly protein FliH [bacterium]MBU4023565.1 flagellar assembly protein FliH [bacterium]MBU4059346.1 flagellar assembly protein FliH [bacterium]MBU4111315.1 flagellar assembly protein FliH [bacterium]
MATVISSSSAEKHNINKYNFKVLALGADKTNENLQANQNTEVIEDTGYTKENNPKKRESDIDSSAMSQGSKDSLIESLLKKTDEMSSNFIKLQMKLEAKEEEFNTQLQKAKEEAFSQGLEAGLAQAKKDAIENNANGLDLFSSSVTKLEKSAKDFETALEGIKGELISAALDISKEVINVEIGTNSAAIAKILSEELIKELQSASKVTLRVNPRDHGFVSEKVGLLEHVSIVSDSAVSPGGVVAISDAGNIDAQISKRFERVKKAALSE